MRYKILLILLFLNFSNLYAQKEILPPNKEFRGIWLTTAWKSDWPKANDEQTQKVELISLFEAIKDANLNAVLFQTRTEGDALYISSKEPWSRWLTGFQGQDPGYDPLAFAIEEAHKRGLELHAWINPFRVTASTEPTTVYSADHITNTRPELLLEYSTGYKMINPGLPEGREYIVSIIAEITQNYDVDGIHFDDYFYPSSGTTNEDLTTFETYGAGFEDIGDWRRHNVNETVRQVQEAIKAIKPGVRFGISPPGIWKDGVPSGISGQDNYTVLYADPVHWIENQTIDYITPQLYWPIGGNQDFKKLLEWWAEKSGNASRHLYAGHTLEGITSSGARTGGNGMRSIATFEANYAVSRHDKSAKTQQLFSQSAEEVPSQIAFVREHRENNALGSVLFTSSFLIANTLGVTDYLKANTYQYPAAPPEMGWIAGEVPKAPENLMATLDEATGDYFLKWGRGDGNEHLFKRYLVYLLASEAGDITEYGALRGLVSQEEIFLNSESIPYGTSYWAATELSELNHESLISNVIPIENNTVPLINSPLLSDMVTETNFVRFEWEGQDEFINYHYQWSTEEDFSVILEENDTLNPSDTARLFNNLEFGETYYFRLRAANTSSWTDWTPSYKITIGQTITGIGKSTILENFKIYPNPSSDLLFVDLNISTSTRVKIDLMAIHGDTKVIISDARLDTGRHKISIDRNQIGAGIYVLIVQVDDHKQVQKIIFN